MKKILCSLLFVFTAFSLSISSIHASENNIIPQDSDQDYIVETQTVNLINPRYDTFTTHYLTDYIYFLERNCEIPTTVQITREGGTRRVLGVKFTKYTASLFGGYNAKVVLADYDVFGDYGQHCKLKYHIVVTNGLIDVDSFYRESEILGS